jgi:uncharacterized protein (DUF2141 family)
MLLPLLLAAQPPAVCAPAAGPSVLVDVSGWKSRAGLVRVRVFGGPPSSYFDKKRALVRLEWRVPASGRVTACIPVPRPGVYAVDVRHDMNNNGDTDRGDGGGASGNPRVSLFDVLLSRRPDPKRVQVQVGGGTTAVPITLMYLQGGSFRPWQAGR